MQILRGNEEGIGIEKEERQGLEIEAKMHSDNKIRT